VHVREEVAEEARLPPDRLQELAGRPEVANLEPAEAVDHEVRRLQIPMEDP